MKSASEQLHGLLMKEEVGFKFTKQILQDMVAEAGMNMSEGAVTGFIHRAVRLGRVRYTRRVAGEQGRMIYQYEIVDREPWAFKHKSRGSKKGRTIGEKHCQEVPEIQDQKHKLLLSDNTPAPVESLYMRLFDLVAEVEALEKKSLKDYSTDELIAELKSRVKG